MAKQKRYSKRGDVLVVETTSDEPIETQEYNYESLLTHRAAVESERDRVFQEKTDYMIELDAAIAEAKLLGVNTLDEVVNES